MKFLLLVLSTVGCCLTAGCGDSRRTSIEGTVTWDGQPLPSGSIVFLPLTGTESPTAGGDIVDGKFSIPAKKGTFEGKFRVEITAERPSGRKIPHPGSGELVEELEQYLPVRYNTASELEVEVEVGVPNRLEFPLRSR